MVEDISNAHWKDTEALPGGVDDMTKIAYLHESGVLHNLSTRYELNEIYVSVLVSWLWLFCWAFCRNVLSGLLRLWFVIV